MYKLFFAILLFTSQLLSEEIVLNGQEFNSNATEIHLSNLDFADVADEIPKFKSLKTLALMNARNLYSLPQKLEHLSGLMSLSLQNCNLSTLPDGIQNLKQLKELNLDGNELVEFPEQILALKNLETLRLQANPLKIVPDALGSLARLTVLSLPCGIDYVPSTLSKLSLQVLSFFNQGERSYNTIKELPDFYLKPFRKLSWLIVYLDDKKIAPGEWRERTLTLREDTSIDIGGEEYDRLETTKLRVRCGALDNIAQLPNLEELSVEDCALDQIPDVVLQLINLKKLELISTDLETLSTNIKSLRNLTVLSIKNNFISHIPSEVSLLTKLETLDLSANFIETISDDLSRLTNLKTLKVTTKKHCRSAADFYDEYHLFYPFREMADLTIMNHDIPVPPQVWQQLRRLLPQFKAFKDKGRKLRTIIQTDFEAMGIGGVDKEIRQVLREVVLPLMSNRAVENKYGVEPQRGILLYGPPGTGKTLLAHQIAKMVEGAIVRFIHGPALVKKYVGDTEEAIRQLFLEAETNPKNIYVIIFDEIDGLFPKRKKSSREHDNKAVTQFLALTGGAHSQKNILIIGVTNRKDNLDEGFLRSGRLGCQVFVGLPTEEARERILSIYLKDLKEQNLLDDIDTKLWAHELEGFSGADIEELVNRAKRLADSRNSVEIESELFVFEDDDSELSLVSHDDLLTAFAEMKNISEAECRQNYPSLNRRVSDDNDDGDEDPVDATTTAVCRALRQLRETLRANAIGAAQDFLMRDPEFAELLLRTARLSKKRRIETSTPSPKKRNVDVSSDEMES